MTSKRPTLKDMVKDPWFKSRPVAVQQKLMKYPPGLYLLKPTSQKVVIYSFEEKEAGVCDTCSVLVLKEYNPECRVERRVFGIPFSELEPIDTI